VGSAGRLAQTGALLRAQSRRLIKKLSKPRFLNGHGHAPGVSAGVILDESWQGPLRLLLVHSSGRQRPHRRSHGSSAFPRIRMAASRAGAVGGRLRTLPDGRRKQRLMEDLAQREEQVRRLASTCCTSRNGAPPHQPRASRRSRPELLCIACKWNCWSRTPGRMETKLREARDLTERTILEMRRLIAALSPAVLEQLGLGAALRHW